MMEPGYMPVFPAILAYVFCDIEMRGRNMIIPRMTMRQIDFATYF
jgi:hypothetical protein